MTAVVGIMNKRGIAIAADSAVTQRIRGNKKISNTGNKMLRLSSVNPVSIMLTGNACLFYTQWDIIVRRYRQKFGDIPFPTVQAQLEDFFSYIPTEELFMPDDIQKEYLNNTLSVYWDRVVECVPSMRLSREKGAKRSDIINAFHERISSGRVYSKKQGTLPKFTNYTETQFRDYLGTMVDDLFKLKVYDNTSDCVDKKSSHHGMKKHFSADILEEIKDEFISGFYDYMTGAWSRGDAHLVFSGYGAKEDYPVIICARVDHGFDGRICYHIKEEDIFKISDKRPVAICPFAQTDIMEGLLNGIDPDFLENICKENTYLFETFHKQIDLNESFGKEDIKELENLLKSVRYKDLTKKLERFGISLCKSNMNDWLKALSDYDLQNMAHLAENLIALTSFERHMTFQQEGVGGPIDVAVISKNKGFTWLNRKSWYHHKDVGGRYGKLGV